MTIFEKFQTKNWVGIERKLFGNNYSSLQKFKPCLILYTRWNLFSRSGHLVISCLKMMSTTEVFWSPNAKVSENES